MGWPTAYLLEARGRDRSMQTAREVTAEPVQGPVGGFPWRRDQEEKE